MAFVTGFYGKGNFSQAVLNLDPGLISISSGSSYSNPANWGKFGNADFPGTGNGAFYYKTIAKEDVRAGTTGIQLSAGGILYSMTSSGQAEQLSNRYFTTDTLSNSSAVEIKNALLCGEFDASDDPEDPNIQSIWIQLIVSAEPEDPSDPNEIYGRISISAGSYTQTKEDDQRTAWNYRGGSWNPSGVLTDYIFRKGTVFNEVRFYKGSIFNDGMDFYVFAFGVYEDTMNNTGDLAASSASYLIAIPCKVFKDFIPRPYVGPVSSESAAASFVPSEEYRGSWGSREIENKNPYGFNAGYGLRLAMIDFSTYGVILQGIYTGVSASFWNAATQLIEKAVGGNGHRPAEEIQPITQGVLCCHVLPSLVSYGSAAGKINTISGYKLFGVVELPVVNCSDTIFEYIPTVLNQPITQRLNSFLDFEPFTEITLHLPFMGDISIPPSLLYGNTLSFHYWIDIFTGIVNCDVIINEVDRHYIFSTQQAQIGADLPIFGAGSNSGILQQVAQGVGCLSRAQSASLRTGESAARETKSELAGAAAAGMAAINEVSKAGQGVPVGRNSVEGIGNYLSPRQAYLIISRPQPSVPEYFLELSGSVANNSGLVKKFTGYAEFSDVDLSDIDATDAEKREILALLKGGVFV